MQTRTTRAVVTTLGALACAVTGLAGSFWQIWQPTVGGVRLPVGLVLSLGALLAVVLTVTRTTGSRPAGVLVLTAWFVAVGAMLFPRPEGDLVVPATAVGYAWILGGVLVGLVAALWPVPVRRGSHDRGPGRDGGFSTGAGAPTTRE